ncbi:hypothetical protein [Massilia sp. DD77]
MNISHSRAPRQRGAAAAGSAGAGRYGIPTNMSDEVHDARG